MCDPYPHLVRPAPFGRRAGAYLLDMALLAVVLAAYGLVFGRLAPEVWAAASESIGPATFAGLLLLGWAALDERFRFAGERWPVFAVCFLFLPAYTFAATYAGRRLAGLQSMPESGVARFLRAVPFASHDLLTLCPCGPVPTGEEVVGAIGLRSAGCLLQAAYLAGCLEAIDSGRTAWDRLCGVVVLREVDGLA